VTNLAVQLERRQPKSIYESQLLRQILIPDLTNLVQNDLNQNHDMILSILAFRMVFMSKKDLQYSAIISNCITEFTDGNKD
jgi:hypothetical protein